MREAWFRERTEEEDDCHGEQHSCEWISEAVQENGERLHGKGVPDDQRTKQKVMIPQELHTVDSMTLNGVYMSFRH